MVLIKRENHFIWAWWKELPAVDREKCGHWCRPSCTFLRSTLTKQKRCVFEFWSNKICFVFQNLSFWGTFSIKTLNKLLCQKYRTISHCYVLLQVTRLTIYCRRHCTFLGRRRPSYTFLPGRRLTPVDAHFTALFITPFYLTFINVCSRHNYIWKICWHLIN